MFVHRQVMVPPTPLHVIRVVGNGFGGTAVGFGAGGAVGDGLGESVGLAVGVAVGVGVGVGVSVGTITAAGDGVSVGLADALAWATKDGPDPLLWPRVGRNMNASTASRMTIAAMTSAAASKPNRRRRPAGALTAGALAMAGATAEFFMAAAGRGAFLRTAGIGTTGVKAAFLPTAGVVAAAVKAAAAPAAGIAAAGVAAAGIAAAGIAAAGGPATFLAGIGVAPATLPAATPRAAAAPRAAAPATGLGIGGPSGANGGRWRVPVPAALAKQPRQVLRELLQHSEQTNCRHSWQNLKLWTKDW
jgi:hypothetical protein